MIPENNFTLEANRSKQLPFVEMNDFDTPILISEAFNYDKDSAERFEMTYQNHMLVNLNDDNYIILGKELLGKMFLAQNKDDLDFIVYGSDSEVYTKDSNEKIKGEPINATYTVTSDSSKIIIAFQGEDLDTKKSFAIGNQNGDLILGINNYHPFSNVYKHSDVIYFKFINSR